MLEKCGINKFYVRNDIMERTGVVNYLGGWLDCELCLNVSIKCARKVAGT